MTVLIITRSLDNQCVDSVMAAIERQGGRAFRFDTDKFPTEVRLIAQYLESSEKLQLISSHGELDLHEVTAIWHRRLEIGGRIPRNVDMQLRMASIDESSRTVKGMLESLKAFRMDPEPVIRRAEHKQIQLQVARELGMDTPRTLITNDADAVRAFAQDCEGGIVTKMLSSFAVYEEGLEKVVFTNPVSRADLEDLNGLSLCPMTFQEQLPKALELRTTVVGDRVFTASIDSQVSAQAQYDWRKDGVALLKNWQRFDLPRNVEQQLLELMDYFALNYGAIDFILTPEGRYVFLEINPVGEFFWLEDSPGLPISSAIADVLLGRAFRREYSR
ncbi:MAG TPA: MvdD family ATP-grasp ribosomal peptide maturase [Pyrinomonadaceae bacterium]|nr:MvdD family ATP-grasp ribosomal peptide maturase [Pyrinomonadaceae bacterium]